MRDVHLLYPLSAFQRKKNWDIFGSIGFMACQLTTRTKSQLPHKTLMYIKTVVSADHIARVDLAPPKCDLGGCVVDVGTARLTNSDASVSLQIQILCCRFQNRSNLLSATEWGTVVNRRDARHGGPTAGLER